MKTSFPRMFSSMRTKISPSAKREQVTFVSSVPRCRPISSASAGLAVPEISLKPSRAEDVTSMT